MSHKFLRYGDLNPATHPQTGRSLDPDAFTGIGNLAEAARRVNRPSFVEKLGFPLKGIILRVEPSAKVNPEASEDADEGWGVWFYNKGQTKPQLWRCRVRIPELHSHLPVPERFGPEGLNSIMIMYPVFQAKDQDTPAPVVGEVCYVDFGDRKRFEDPIYLGMVKSGGSPADGGASSDSEGNSASQAANANDNNLNAAAPPGDPIGQGGDLDPNGQTPVETPPLPDSSEIQCRPYTRNTVSINPPSCAPYNQTTPGLYRTTGPRPGAPLGDYDELGDQEMDEWVNRQAGNKLVLASLKHTLQLMEAAFIEETGISDVDVKKFINDGFRPFEKQACFREKYEACRREWRRRGRDPDEKPFPVGVPGPGKHSSGVAVDFNADGTNRDKRTRTTALWQWLQANSTRFGWRWTGGNFNPSEAWHYEFDYALAQSLGLFPRNGVTQNVPAR